jgi:hypothetical protein
MKTMHTHVRKLGGPTWKNWERKTRFSGVLTDEQNDILDMKEEQRKRNEIKAQKRLEKAQNTPGAVIGYPKKDSVEVYVKPSLMPLYENGVCLTLCPGITIQKVKHGATKRARLISYPYTG